MILITTAGKVGAAAARLLAQREEPVRVLVRDPEKVAVLTATRDNRQYSHAARNVTAIRP